MSCPNCGEKMESENAPITGKVLRASPQQNAHPWPSMHYRCNNCDSEWIWIKGERPALRLLDSAFYPMLDKRRLLPVDSHSQLGTGYTGRSDLDGRMQYERHGPKRGFLA